MWNRVGHDSAIFAASALVMALLQVAFRLLAIHDLSLDAYGHAALLLSVFNGALVFGNFGIPAAAARLAARSSGLTRGREVLRVVTRTAMLPSVIASLGLGSATYVITHSTGLAVVCAIGVIPMVLSSVYAGFVRGRGFVWAAASVQPANVAVQLIVLLTIPVTGVGIGVGWVMICFCIGNVAALALALIFIALWERSLHSGESGRDFDAQPKRILAFSAWLSLSNAAVIAFGIVPRIALAHVSYVRVAAFDLALLIYTVPQRLIASLVIALIPAAAARQLRGSRITIPTAWDAVGFGVLVALVDLVLWSTHVLRTVFDAVGLGHYSAAEPLLLVLLLATPAELSFAVTAGILQAFGRSRQLAITTLGVLVGSTLLTPVALQFGDDYIAVLLVIDYWILCFATRSFAPSEVEERSVFLRLIPLRRFRARVDYKLRGALPASAYMTVRRSYAKTWRAARLNPGRGRILPDFVVIGAAKCGTTSLYGSLADHPFVTPCITNDAHFVGTKEVHYFDYNFYRGEDWYRSHFPLQREQDEFEREHGKPFLTGEASPSYISHFWAPNRLHALLPDAKLLVVLRNPVDRAYSQYQMSRREGLEELDCFADAVDQEDERLADDLERMAADPLYNSWDFGRWSYLARSRYAEQLERWLELFERNRILFVKSEDLSAQPASAMNRVYEFLGLPAHRANERATRLHTAEYPDMPSDVRARLSDYFRPHNERLYELVGIDFGWERESRPVSA